MDAFFTTSLRRPASPTPSDLDNEPETLAQEVENLQPPPEPPTREVTLKRFVKGARDIYDNVDAGADSPEFSSWVMFGHDLEKNENLKIVDPTMELTEEDAGEIEMSTDYDALVGDSEHIPVDSFCELFLFPNLLENMSKSNHLELIIKGKRVCAHFE